MAVASTEAKRIPSRFSLAATDLARGLGGWRVFGMLALLETRQRYRRSSLGQFWITLSMAAQILGIGIVFSVILDQPLAKYLPYLGVGIVLWAFIVGTMNSTTTVFISSELYLRAYNGPRSLVIYRAMVRELISLFHNLVIVLLLLVGFQIDLSWHSLLFIPAVVLVAANGIWIGMLVGTLATRFRDLPLIVSNIMQLAFFMTPVMYRPDHIMERLWAISHLNPFASWLEIMRAPLLGTPASLHHWTFSACTLVLGYAVAFPFFARFRERIVYWL